MHELSNEELVKLFYEFKEKSKVSISNLNRYLKNHFQDLYNEIERRTIKLNQYKKIPNGKTKMQDISIFERIYCLIHNLDDRPLCKYCKIKRVAGFNKQLNTYGDYCSQTCQRKSPECIAKQLKSKEQKYGKDNITNAKKACQTRIEKYGSHHPTNFSDKVKTTKLKNYGNENFVNVEKQKQTVAKHIAENPNYYFDREQKTKQTKVANGHNPNWNNRKKFKETLSTFTNERKNEIIEKRKQTCLDTYGVEYATQSLEVQQRAKQKCLKKYGVISTLTLSYTRNLMYYTLRTKAWSIFEKNNYDVVPLITKDEFIHNLDLDLRVDLLTWQCKTCGHIFQHTWANWARKCPKCFPQNYRGLQNEVADYVKSICDDNFIIRLDCKNVLSKYRQLDIFVKDLNIAIEFNGCFWHNSDKGAYGNEPTPMMYHYDKSTECEQLGIQLIHIFEDEWLSNKKLCKAKLRKILMPNTVKHIDGQCCSIVTDIDKNLARAFLNKYSFYGNDKSSIQYCLTFNGYLVAMMTFSKTRNNKQYDWQILNYLEINSHIVDDGFKILIQKFKNDHIDSTVCFYASRDWENVNAFNGIMDLVSIKKPRVFWTISDIRIKGHDMTKSLAKSLCISNPYDDTKSMSQNLNANNIYRIYDSGTLVFKI